MKHQKIMAAPQAVGFYTAGSRRLRFLGYTIAMIILLLMYPINALSSDFDLTELSIEELMNIEVTSVSKKAEKLSEAAAAIYVITADDIRRSGFTSIPEALRMVPGLQVARIDLNTWAITARGFNSQFASKLLVLVDGRSVYTPLYSGVYWDVQNVMLENIERIEVIRGPGATLWGANAVNGVINIITKKASDTQGGFVSATSGTEEHYSGTVRYGGKLGDNAFYRIYGNSFNRYQSGEMTTSQLDDEWNNIRGGLRMDWELSKRNSLTLQGDLTNGTSYHSIYAPILTPPYSRMISKEVETLGANALSRFSHFFSAYSDLDLQVYFDHTDVDILIGQEKRSTLDVDFQHRYDRISYNEIIWGLGYRYTKDDIASTEVATFDIKQQKDNLFSAFIQDKVTFLQNKLSLTVGSKFEHNDYTGFEYQPNIRFLWTPSYRHTFWSAVSRAIRTPSRGESTGKINAYTLPPGTTINPSPYPAIATILNEGDFKSEELYAYECGYRVMPMDILSISTDVFYNRYDNLRSLKQGMAIFHPPPNQYLTVPLILENQSDCETYGIEMSTDWLPRHWWRLKVAYTYLTMKFLDGDFADDGTTNSFSDFENFIPHHQVFVRSSLDLSRAIEFDTNLRYVDKLTDSDIDSYLAVDLRLAWKPFSQMDVFVVGQNLLESQHREYNSSLGIQMLPSEIERTVYLGTTWNF